MPSTIEINQVGKREDLRDIISLADVRERPLLAMAMKLEAPKNMTVQWQVDAYDAASTDNAVADGVDVKSFGDKAKNRALISNYAQKFRKAWMVGDEAENISNVAGLSGGEAGEALDHCIEEIGRDIEKTLCSSNGAQLEVDEDTPYKTRGLSKFLVPAGAVRDSVTVDTVLPIPTAYYIPRASLNTTATASIVENAAAGSYTSLNEVLTSVYTQWGKSADMTLIAGTTLKSQISGFTMATSGSTNTQMSVRSFDASLDGKTIVRSITRYEGDYNAINIIPSLLLPSAGYGYVIPPDFLGVAFGRQPRARQLEDQGGGPRGYVDAIVALVVKNPTVFGIFEG
jgi:hypothetical protein